TLVDARAGIDSNGKIVGYDSTFHTLPYYFYGPGDTVMQALGTALPSTLSPSASPGGSHSLDIRHLQVPAQRELPKAPSPVARSFKTSYLRSPYGAGGAFASAQMIDELAHAAGADPIASQLQNLTSTDADRWTAVITAVAQAANWKPKVAASQLSDATTVT